MNIFDIKSSICEAKYYELLAPSVFNPTEEKLKARAEKYQKNENVKIFAYEEDGEFKGVIVFDISENNATILDIAVKPRYQKSGIGTRLINFIFSKVHPQKITAETDDDAIGFYKKYGFTVAYTKVEFGTKRYACVCESITHHYDLLIDENNDPVHDPKPLQDYMDKWDGQAFIDKMELDVSKSVLEIGVGTGRLAVRVVPLCCHFCGIDLSLKTVERANANLSGLSNVTLVSDDFLSFDFNETFDVIYSSLTFMHIEEKSVAINKAAALLNKGGIFMLSIDKSQNTFIDTGSSKIKIYPDSPENIESLIIKSGLKLSEHYETEFAHIFKAIK